MLHLKNDPAQNMGNTGYGNRQGFRFVLSTDSAGRALGATSLQALNIGTQVVVGVLPEGLRITDSQVLVTDAMGAGVTAKLGFVYADGVDSNAVPQDAAYFGTGLALSAVARLRNAVAKASHKLPKPALVVLEIAGANVAESGRVEVHIEGVTEG